MRTLVSAVALNKSFTVGQIKKESDLVLNVTKKQIRRSQDKLKTNQTLMKGRFSQKQ